MGNVNKVTVAVQGETRSQKAETFENPVAIESVKKEQDDGHKSTVEAEEKLRHEKDDCEEDSRL